MRFNSSETLAAENHHHLKKNGTPDLRSNSSKLESKIKDMHNIGESISSNIPVTKKGFPDMRYKEAKQWVQQQAAQWTKPELPPWVPKTKDGTV